MEPSTSEKDDEMEAELMKHVEISNTKKVNTDNEDEELKLVSNEDIKNQSANGSPKFKPKVQQKLTKRKNMNKNHLKRKNMSMLKIPMM